MHDIFIGTGVEELRERVNHNNVTVIFARC
jgi:rRNA-processing protein FCF1